MVKTYMHVQSLGDHHFARYSHKSRSVHLAVKVGNSTPDDSMWRGRGDVTPGGLLSNACSTHGVAPCWGYLLCLGSCCSAVGSVYPEPIGCCLCLIVYVLQGPSKRMLYCPDIDSWQAFADSGAGRIQDVSSVKGCIHCLGICMCCTIVLLC